MRAIFLGSSAFPPIIRLWLETAKIWQDEVDKIYIAVDYPNKIDDDTRKLCKEFPKIVLLENTTKWPGSYNDAYKASREDTFLIMHDDTLVYRKGVLDKYFKLAEEGKVAVPTHQIYEPASVINEYLIKRYGFKIEDAPFSFLLYFLFISRENLEKTTMDFNGKGWNIGDDISLLGVTNSPTTVGGDTGFLLSLELFENKVPFYNIKRSDTAILSYAEDSLEALKKWRDNNEEIFKEGWLHIYNTGNSIPTWYTADLDDREWDGKLEEMRLVWLYLMLKLLGKPKYWKVWEKVRRKCDIDYDRIFEMANILNNLLFGKNLI